MWHFKNVWRFVSGATIKTSFYLLEWRSRAQYTQKLENSSFVNQIMTNAPVIRVWMEEPVSTSKENLPAPVLAHTKGGHAKVGLIFWFSNHGNWTRSGVQFGLKSYAGFQNWTSAQREFDLKSQVWFQTKIARPEVQLPLYIHFEIAQFNSLNTRTTRFST